MQAYYPAALVTVFRVAKFELQFRVTSPYGANGIPYDAEGVNLSITLYLLFEAYIVKDAEVLYISQLE